MRSAVLVSLFFTALAAGQEQKHVTAVPVNGARPATLTANDIERGSQYPSAIHLKGGVEIKAPVCMQIKKRGKLVCDGSMILRADEATYHEDSGKIEASGTVSITPLRHDEVSK
jgi:hypothetical protein